ncbi:MAG: sulfatase-like hydrolase/transferase [Anaerolineales bacterium]
MKKIFRIIVPIIYISTTIISILLIIKPGASIFHFKQSLDSEVLRSDESYTFSIPLKINPLIFPAEGVLLFEDGQQLERTFTAEVVEKGLGKYSLVDKDGFYNLLFSASDNSDPLTNGKQYTLYLRMFFFSRSTGLTLMMISILGLSWFLIFAFKSPARRKSILASPLTIWQVFNEFLDQEVTRALTPITNKEPSSQSKQTMWIFLLVLTVGAAYFYLFMEWVFFVTKPSFMAPMGWFDKFEIFLLSSFVLCVFSLVLVMTFAGVDLLISKFRFTMLPIFIGTLIPTVILTAISLLLVDNFTYTVFKFGVFTSDGIIRYGYRLGFLILFIYINTRILRMMGLRGKPKPPFKVPRFILVVIAGMFVISTVIVLIRFGVSYSRNAQAVDLAGDHNRFATRPNIILLGSDGLSASNLSVYGYERETTPVLKELAKTSLLAENIFANSSKSTGSITSMLTGKPDVQTRVLYPPNILQGVDAYQHLPGILRNGGYYNVEIGVPHYIDAYKVNMLDGFDIVNDRSIGESELVRSAREKGFGENPYFVSLLAERITDRILHIFFIRKMENPFTIVTQPVGIKHDQEQLNNLIQLIQESDQPLFIHVHMMGTHGARFKPKQRVFSKGKTQDDDWMIDFYDDSILNFDQYIGEVLEILEQTGKMDNTILIIYSDHPMQSNARWRAPLLIHVPNDEFAGRIETNVQNLDIATTILDYLGINQPEWMAGQSLLKDDILENEVIFSTGTSLVALIGQGRWSIESARVKPPFYHFSFFNLVNCHKWYWFNLSSLTWESGDVPRTYNALFGRKFIDNGSNQRGAG